MTNSGLLGERAIQEAALAGAARVLSTISLPGMQDLTRTLQNRVDEVTARAKLRPNARSRRESVLRDADVRFLEFLYTAIGQGGRLVGESEAAQLVRRYLDVDATGVEEVKSAIYQRSEPVQREVAKQKAQIRSAASRGTFSQGGTYSIHANARRTESCEHAKLKRPPPERMVRADEDLKKVNNRFWVQSYSTRVGKTVTTKFVVTDCYEFEPFSKRLYTELELLGQKLRIEDGLSEYLTRIGLARTFTYESSWSEVWELGR